MDNAQFTALLKDLESYFNFPLEPDSNNSCLIQLKSGIQIQIEPDRYNHLLVVARLGIIPSSRYRELVFKEALKANGIQHPNGVFGLSRKSGQLILFLSIDDRKATKEHLTTILPSFLEKAHTWAEAIKRGDVPIGIDSSANASKPNIFGMFNK